MKGERLARGLLITGLITSGFAGAIAISRGAPSIPTSNPGIRPVFYPNEDGSRMIVVFEKNGVIFLQDSSGEPVEVPIACDPSDVDVNDRMNVVTLSRENGEASYSYGRTAMITEDLGELALRDVPAGLGLEEC